MKIRNPKKYLLREVFFFILLSGTVHLAAQTDSSRKGQKGNFFQRLTHTYKSNIVDVKDTVPRGADSNYIHSFEKYLVGRLYFSRKLNSFTVKGSDGLPNLKYLPNNASSIGLGFTYRFITLSLGIFNTGAPQDSKGKTRSFDFQTNIFLRHWAVDLMFRTYKGHYLSDKSLLTGNSDLYYINPQLRGSVGGITLWRIMNPERFSYRAAMTQNEIQIKSSGSFLIGGEAYYGSTNAHGDIVPSAVAGNYPQRGVQKLHFFKIGPGLGYAYNLIFLKNFFLSGGLTANLDLGFAREYTDARTPTQLSFSPNITYRLGLGYNINSWCLMFNILSNNMPIKGDIPDSRYALHAGSYQLSFNKRFGLGKKAKKTLAPLDKQLDKLPSLEKRP